MIHINTVCVCARTLFMTRSFSPFAIPIDMSQGDLIPVKKQIMAWHSVRFNLICLCTALECCCCCCCLFVLFTRLNKIERNREKKIKLGHNGDDNDIMSCAICFQFNWTEINRFVPTIMWVDRFVRYPVRLCVCVCFHFLFYCNRTLFNGIRNDWMKYVMRRETMRCDVMFCYVSIYTQFSVVLLLWTHKKSNKH